MRYVFKVPKKGIVEIQAGDTVMVFRNTVEDDACLGHVITFLAQWTGDPSFEHDLKILIKKYQATQNLVNFPSHVPCSKCDQPIELGQDKYTAEHGIYAHVVCPWKLEDVP